MKSIMRGCAIGVALSGLGLVTGCATSPSASENLAATRFAQEAPKAESSPKELAAKKRKLLRER